MKGAGRLCQLCIVPKVNLRCRVSAPITPSRRLCQRCAHMQITRRVCQRPAGLIGAGAGASALPSADALCPHADRQRCNLDGPRGDEHDAKHNPYPEQGRHAAPASLCARPAVVCSAFPYRYRAAGNDLCGGSGAGRAQRLAGAVRRSGGGDRGLFGDPHSFPAPRISPEFSRDPDRRHVLRCRYCSVGAADPGQLFRPVADLADRHRRHGLR